MPYAKSGDAEIYFESTGAGPPILLIPGWTYPGWIWYKQIPELSKCRRLITVDLRGTGKSSKPDYPYTIEMMARDCIAVVREAGEESVHVAGLSMGGMVAIEMALIDPKAVRSLTLISTHHGGNIAPSPREVLRKLTALEPGDPREVKRERLKLAFSKSFISKHPEVLDEILDRYFSSETPYYAVCRQLQAVLKFNAERRLKEIRAPTLIVAGSEDIVVNPENSRMLLKKIPNSKLVVFKGAGHMLNVERAEDFNRLLLEFTGEVESNTVSYTPKVRFM